MISINEYLYLFCLRIYIFVSQSFNHEMILAFDTFYFDDSAKTVGIQFNHWTDASEIFIYEETLNDVAPYVSGQFYKRELPCILSLLKQIDLTKCKAIVIDGFVVLDDKGGKGLGGYLYESLGKKIPIIGVAKNDFSKIFKSKRAVVRGNSKKLLFVTVMGMDLETAAKHVKNMHGNFRIPTLLKKVDALGRA